MVFDPEERTYPAIGAVTLGYGVSSKITKGVAKVDTPDCWGCGYSNSKMSVYAVGMVAALVGAALVLVIGSFTRMPASLPLVPVL